MGNNVDLSNIASNFAVSGIVNSAGDDKVECIVAHCKAKEIEDSIILRNCSMDRLANACTFGIPFFGGCIGGLGLFG